MRKAIVLLICVGLVLPVFGQNWDIDLLTEINLNRNVHLDETFRTITYSAAPITYGIPVVLFSIGLLKKDSLMRQKALYIGTSVLTSAAISSILKYSIHRVRPFVTYTMIQSVADGGTPSFPSGHTSDAFAFATSISIAYPKWYVIVPSFFWAGAVGYSRMDLGVHYPSDVLAGAIIGSGSAFISYKLNNWLLSRKSRTALKNHG